MNNNERYIKLKDFYTIAFLFANGCEIAGVDKNQPKKQIFSFIPTDKCFELLEKYNKRKIKIEPHLYADAINEIKRILYEE